MKIADGSIGLDHRHPHEGAVLEVLDDAQQLVTGSRFTHVKWYVMGSTWESTMERVEGWGWLPVSGIVRTPGVKSADLWREPVTALTWRQVEDLYTWSEVALWQGSRYNIAGLIADALVVPTRAFWDWLGWTPWGSNMHEAVCSVACGRAFVLGANTDQWPPRKLATLTPGDFAMHPFWRDYA